MTEIISIGRVFDGYEADVGTAAWSGDTLTLTGEVYLGAGVANRVDVAKAMRDRFTALADNRDETVVAVRWTEDSTIDGFYRPLAAGAAFSQASLNDGYLSWEVEMRRAGGGSLPQVEVYGMHAVRTNPHSITNASLSNPFTGYPDAAYDSWAGAEVLFGATRVSATGTIYLGKPFVTLPTAFPTTFSVPVADHYDGACGIRTTYGAATSQLVGGRWAPSSWVGVTLSNGLIRVSKHASSDTGLFIEVYDGTQWEPLHASTTSWIVESDWAGGTMNWLWGSAGMQILRNSPEACSIRLFTPQAAVQGTFGRVWLDLTVQRGKRHISGVVRSDEAGNSDSNKFALEPSTSIAATALTGGVRATANDAQGNRAVWGAAGFGSITNNLVSGRLVQTSAGLTQMPFFVGVELTGSAATGEDAAQQIIYQWYDVASETQRVVRR